MGHGRSRSGHQLNSFLLALAIKETCKNECFAQAHNNLGLRDPERQFEEARPSSRVQGNSLLSHHLAKIGVETGMCQPDFSLKDKLWGLVLSF